MKITALKRNITLERKITLSWKKFETKIITLAQNKYHTLKK